MIDSKQTASDHIQTKTHHKGLFNRFVLSLLSVATCVSTFILATFLYFGRVDQTHAPDKTQARSSGTLSQISLQTPTALALQPNNASGLHSIADIAEIVTPSVVNISSTRKVKNPNAQLYNHPFFKEFFGNQAPPERMQRGLGSGVIISNDGIVITNNHVVEKADEVKVTLNDQREIDAEVIGTDPKSDLAVLKLKNTTNLRPIKIGKSNQNRLGEVVIAVGNPFGVGQTVTMGIISAKGRANMGIVDYEDFIQTDAAINPGNSGGALINLRGELIGINTAILSKSGGYQGIGFAIPTDMAMPIVNSLRKTGKVVRGYLGVMIQDVDENLKTALKLPSKKGVLVSDVLPDSPASKAGLKRGDFVLSVDGKAVDSASRLRNTVASLGTKRRVKIIYVRSGSESSTIATLGALPSNEKQASKGGKTKKIDDIVVAKLNQEIRRKYRLSDRIKTGVVITDLKPNSKAAQAGLRPGDVILEVNRRSVRSKEDFLGPYRKPNAKLLLLISRDTATHYLVIK